MPAVQDLSKARAAELCRGKFTPPGVLARCGTRHPVTVRKQVELIVVRYFIITLRFTGDQMNNSQIITTLRKLDYYGFSRRQIAGDS